MSEEAWNRLHEAAGGDRDEMMRLALIENERLTHCVQAAEARASGLQQAAEHIIAESQQAVGLDDPFGSQGPPILVGANAWFELQTIATPGKTQAETRAAVASTDAETPERKEQ